MTLLETIAHAIRVSYAYKAFFVLGLACILLNWFLCLVFLFKVYEFIHDRRNLCVSLNFAFS